MGNSTGKNGGNIQELQLAAGSVTNLRNGIQEDHFLNGAFLNAIVSRTGQNTMGSAGINSLGTANFHQGLGSVAQRTGSVHDIIVHNAGLALNITDNIHNLADVGSVGRARAFAAKVHMGLAIVDKRRPKANVSEVMNIIGDVKDKTCILYDDLVDTAGSLCNAAQALVEIGGAKAVYACATHGVLSGPAYDRIEASPIKEMVFLNTIPQVANTASNKLVYLDVAPVFAHAISHVHGGTSIADLF